MAVTPDMITWTVVAVDEFDRVFNYTQIENPMMRKRMYIPEVVWEYMFKKAVREILTEMGEAAHAEWRCIEGRIKWNFD